MYERLNLVWDGTDLRLGKHGRVLATVVPDVEWSNMWRVRLPNGWISDMANLSRAKDAAASLALAALNKRMPAVLVA